MKRSYLTLLLGITFFGILTSCSLTETGELELELEDNQVLLNYDGRNVSAPILPPNTYEAAIKLSETMMGEVDGGKLVAVQVFFGDLPIDPEVKIYRGTFDGEPDELIHSVAFPSNLSGGAWNLFTLPEPVDLTGDEHWIAVRFSIDSDRAVIGCDAGPADNFGGDWTYDDADGLWRSLRIRTDNQIDINWNIRGIAEVN